VKIILPCVVSLLIVAGCTSGNSSDDATVKLPEGAGKPLNPSGQMTPEQQAKADKITADAQKAGAARAAAMRDARAGGK
jgi:hypothetical protein